MRAGGAPIVLQRTLGGLGLVGDAEAAGVQEPKVRRGLAHEDTLILLAGGARGDAGDLDEAGQLVVGEAAEYVLLEGDKLPGDQVLGVGALRTDLALSVVAQNVQVHAGGAGRPRGSAARCSPG